MSNFQIDYGILFRKEFRNFPEQDQDAIVAFVEHILSFGFNGLEGINKRSDDVRKDDPLFAQKVQYAQTHHLWHYHIGIPEYNLNKPFGKRTSEYVLHYQLLGLTVRIVDYSSHPPFKLPNIDYLK